MTIRVGNGIDVHAFADGIPLWLSGIHIPHPRGLAGHSDGDAAIHAVVDALLGAAGRGDIGEWFPSTDERWRGVNSTRMLEHVWSAVHADGWRLVNLDLTLVAAEPKLAPFRLAMRQALAATLQAPLDTISLKATTTDGLGALGRAEGVLALATVLLEKN
jgi:2-C-methyl-D-erythritol 2,4-cyclodiphosphate synthase